MKSRLLLLLLCLWAAPVSAELSGIDIPGTKDSVRTACAGIEAGLAGAEARYRVLASSAMPAPEAWAAYRDGLAETGEAVKGADAYVEEFSGLMEGLEKADQKPDDMNDLRVLRAYAEARRDAVQAHYAAALQKLDQLEERLASSVPVPLDPAAADAEKKRQLQAAEKARQLGDKGREFAAIRQFSGLDPQRGGEMMNKFFDGLSPAERGDFAVRLQEAKRPAVKGGSALAPGARVPKPLYRPMGAVVPGVSDPRDEGLAQGRADAGKPARKEKPAVTGADLRLGMWSAVGKFSPGLAAPHLREASLEQAAGAKADWLGKKRQDFLALAAGAKSPEERAGHERTAAGIDALLAKRGPIGELGGAGERGEALGEWNSSVTRLLDGSQEGKTERELLERKGALDAQYAALKTDAERAKWLKERGAEYDENGGRLAAFYQGNREYLAARAAAAESQRFLRASLPNFSDGTNFTAGELGLPLPPGQKVSVSALKDGPRGVSYTGADGLAHFQSFDDTVRVNEFLDASGGKRSLEMRVAADGTVNSAERLPGGQLLKTEQRRPDGTLTVEVYGPDGKAAASRLTRPDGSSVEAQVLGKEGVKRVIYTDAKGAATWEAASVAGGYPKQSGRIVGGVMVLDRLELDPKTAKVRTGDYILETRGEGKPQGLEVDAEAIKRLPEAQRAAAAREAADALAPGDKHRAGPLAQFINQASRQGGPGGQTSIIAAKDDKGNPVYLARITYADGSFKEVLGQWDKLSKAEAAGLPSDVGLNISVRSGATEKDLAERQYLKLFRFCGDNVTDRYGAESRVTGNWFVGYGAEADNYVHRSYSGTNRDFKTIHTGTEELFTSPSIFGHAGNAVGTLGKGAVQLTGSAIAVVGAGTVGWADKHLQAEFLERAKSNFYGNDVSRTLGRDYLGDRYTEGYAGMKVDDTRNIQNVGSEMASMGRPTLGAVLQGGVEFSNGVATSLITAPLGGPVTGALGKTGTVGATVANVAGKGYGAYKSVKGVYDTGAAGVEFVQAYRAFDEHDPASKERYYAAVTDLTAKGLNAPKTVSGAFKLAETAKDVRGALSGKGPSPILGADGKPYQAPPAELSDFRKFMLGKNEPGMLTRVMTKDLGGGLDPKINIDLSNNPVSRAVNAVDRWATAKVDRWSGKDSEIAKPGLIIPGQAIPNPDAKIVVPGQAVPRPEAKIIVPGQAAAKPDAVIIIPGQAVPRPDVKIVIPGQVEPRPDVKLVLPGGD